MQQDERAIRHRSYRSKAVAKPRCISAFPFDRRAWHIAVAATKSIPYLLTWNCRHLANAVMRPVIEAVCQAKGYRAPIICTPEELLGGTS